MAKHLRRMRRAGGARPVPGAPMSGQLMLPQKWIRVQATATADSPPACAQLSAGGVYPLDIETLEWGALQPGCAELEWAIGSQIKCSNFHADTLPKQRMQRRSLLHLCHSGPRHAWLHMHRLQAPSLPTGPGRAQSMAQRPGCAGAGAAGPGACAACRPCMPCCARRGARA